MSVGGTRSSTAWREVRLMRGLRRERSSRLFCQFWTGVGALETGRLSEVMEFMRFMGGVGMCVDPLTRISWADPSAPRTAGLLMGTPMTSGGRPPRAGDADCSGRQAQITTVLRHDRTPLAPGAAIPAQS